MKLRYQNAMEMMKRDAPIEETANTDINSVANIRVGNQYRRVSDCTEQLYLTHVRLSVRVSIS